MLTNEPKSGDAQPSAGGGKWLKRIVIAAFILLSLWVYSTFGIPFFTADAVPSSVYISKSVNSDDALAVYNAYLRHTWGGATSKMSSIRGPGGNDDYDIEVMTTYHGNQNEGESFTFKKSQGFWILVSRGTWIE